MKFVGMLTKRLNYTTTNKSIVVKYVSFKQRYNTT